MQTSNRPRRGWRVALAVAPLVAGCASVVGVLVQQAAPAYADSQPFELYCPGTPVGDIALNGAMVSGSLTPATPASGQQFNLTNFQTTVTLPSNIAGAAAALGNTSIAGTAVATVDATGATPAQVKSGNIPINTPIPSPIPPNGLPLQLPSPPGSVGPFTASGGPITLTFDQTSNLSLTVSGSQLNLTCTAYPNNTVASGIVTAKPSAQPMSPTIVTASASGAAATPATTAPPPVSSAAAGGTTPTTAPASSPSMAFTGPGPHLWLIAVIGFIVLYLGAVVLALVDDPRRRFRRILAVAVPTGAIRFHGRRAPPVPDVMAPGASHVAVVPVAPMEAAPDEDVAPPGGARTSGGSEALWLEPGLWHTGWEPRNRTD